MVVVVVVVEVVVVLVDVVVVGGAVVVVVGGTVVVGARGGGRRDRVGRRRHRGRGGRRRREGGRRRRGRGAVVAVVVVIAQQQEGAERQQGQDGDDEADDEGRALRVAPLATPGQVGGALALALTRDRRRAEHGGGARGRGLGADRVDELGGRLERVDGLARPWTRCAGHGERVADRPGGLGVPGRIAGSGRRGEGIVGGRGNRLRGVGIGRRLGAGARRRAGLALGCGAIGRGAIDGLVVAGGAVGAVVTGRVGSHGRQPRTRGARADPPPLRCGPWELRGTISRRRGRARSVPPRGTGRIGMAVAVLSAVAAGVAACSGGDDTGAGSGEAAADGAEAPPRRVGARRLRPGQHPGHRRRVASTPTRSPTWPRRGLSTASRASAARRPSSDGTVYVGDWTGHVRALDAATRRGAVGARAREQLRRRLRGGRRRPSSTSGPSTPASSPSTAPPASPPGRPTIDPYPKAVVFGSPVVADGLVVTGVASFEVFVPGDPPTPSGAPSWPSTPRPATRCGGST